ncbi:MAG TPA: trypsin-like peptidase domain-containing protein [Pirellulales bacterium]|nr:trypsin-like peptidase domain-containing protein [Pirellulales bacterium]
MANDFFVFLNGREVGPLSYAEVLACVRRGEISGSTLIRCGKRDPAPAMYILHDELAGRSQMSGWIIGLVAIVVAVPLVGLVGHSLFSGSSAPADNEPALNERPAEAPSKAMAEAIEKGRWEDTQPAENRQAEEPTSAKIDHARLAGLETGVVYIAVNNRWSGSGFLVDGETIATNAHVIDGARKVTVQFRDGSSCTSDGWRAFNRSVDLAIIAVDRPPLSAATLELADSVQEKGEDVVAIGAPLDLKWTLTKGAVSGIRTGDEVNTFARQNKAVTNFDPSSSWVQHTAEIDHGSSGGPLIDSLGRVIGVNTLCFPGEVGSPVRFASASENLRELMRTMSASPRDYSELPSPRMRRVPAAQLDPRDSPEAIRIANIMSSLMDQRKELLSEEKRLLKQIAALVAKRENLRGGIRQQYTTTIGQTESYLDSQRTKRANIEQTIRSWADKYFALTGQ